MSENDSEAVRRRTEFAGPVEHASDGILVVDASGAIIFVTPASTVHRVLVRRHLNRLSWIDRPTGQVIRRYEHEHPGDLVHVDVKKLGRIPPGGGWRVHGYLGHGKAGVGYDYIHSAVDDHSRLAYSEICGDERATTSAAFWTRATAFFAAHGITVQRILTDNAQVYRRSFAFRAAVRESGAVPPRQRFTQPWHPQTNGKVERFNRTLLEEWAYVRPYTSNQRRAQALTTWLHIYNHRRAHTSLGQLPPISRINNVSGRSALGGRRGKVAAVLDEIGSPHEPAGSRTVIDWPEVCSRGLTAPRCSSGLSERGSA